MENLNCLLNEISKITEREKALRAEKQKRGENFNIFAIMQMQYNEVYTHSALIAELLNPNGSHGLQDAFLKTFIEETCDTGTCKFDSASARVDVEYTTGAKSDDETVGGRIDILIQDGYKNAIIIENKINAEDQPKQLLRYKNFAKNEFKDGSYQIFYLTLDGHEPAESSCGEKDDDENCNYYKCLSYREDIIKWLTTCEGIASRHPLVRETIIQYQNNLKEILGIMDNNNQKELINLLSRAENIEQAFAIGNNFASIKNHIVNEIFVSQLKGKKELGYIAEEKELSNTEPNCGFAFNPRNWKYFSINFRFQCKEYAGLCYGISPLVHQGKTKTIEELMKLNVSELEGPNEWWPVGSKYMSHPFKDWDAEAFKAILDGQMLEKFEGAIKEIGDKMEDALKDKELKI